MKKPIKIKNKKTKVDSELIRCAPGAMKNSMQVEKSTRQGKLSKKKFLS